MIMTGSLFKSEAEFEKALINTLKNKGWKGDVFYRCLVLKKVDS